MRPNSKIWREIKRWAPGVLISGIALFTIFRIVSWQDLDKAFSTIRFIYLVPGFILVLLWLFMRAVAVKTILSGKPSVWQAFRAINSGYLLNNLLPLRAGEFGKALVLGRSSGLGATFVLSGIVIERAFDLIFAAGFLLISLPFVLEMNWAKPVAIITIVIVIIALVTLYLIAKFNDTIKRWVGNLSQRFRWVDRFIMPQLESFLSGLQVLTDLKRFAACLGLIGSSWVVAVFLYYLMMFSITNEAQVWWGVFANSVLALGIALPSAPAALGVFEAALVGGLKILGIQYSDAFAYAVMMHFLQFAITGVIGFISLTIERQSIGSLFSLVRAKKQESKPIG